jgi:hypothetical protein
MLRAFNILCGCVLGLVLAVGLTQVPLIRALALALREVWP